MTEQIFKGKNIYVGIDVHKRSWDIKILTEHSSQRQLHKLGSDPSELSRYLHQRYPGGNYKCVYEAGFCGFWIQEKLQNLGVQAIVVHPGDVPTTDKEKRFKNDRLDSIKLATSLRSGQLNGIYIPPKQQQYDRSMVRQRYQYMCDEKRLKNRITSHLDFYGIKVDEIKKGSHWSLNYIKHLEHISDQRQDRVLARYLSKLKFERDFVAESLRELKTLARQQRYNARFDLITSVPGVGLLTAMVFLTEIGDISRFKKDDHYISYIGLTPSNRSSGEKSHVGRLSKRGNRRVRTALILSAWSSIKSSSFMAAYYEQYRSEGKTANKAIVKIAKKLALIIKAVLRDQTKYDENKRSISPRDEKS